MRFPFLLLVATTLLPGSLGQATAESTQATFRMSWNSCDPQRPDTVFAGPGRYKLIISVANLTPGRNADDNLGTEMELPITPDEGAEVPDAWRFDNAGCQTEARFATGNGAFNSACRALLGSDPIALAFYDYHSETKTCAIRLANAYGVFSPAAGVRYTAWQLWFDMTRAVMGPGVPAVSCGGAEKRVRIYAKMPRLIAARGVYLDLRPTPGDRGYLLWGEEAPVATEPITWARVKAIYR